ncbi:unnamed protein product, partial [Rotaria sp. Silwood1]
MPTVKGTSMHLKKSDEGNHELNASNASKLNLKTVKGSESNSSANPVLQAKPSKPELVYVSDLPSGIPQDDLKKMIQTRLSDATDVQAIGVECYPKLAIALIHLSNEKDRNRLILNVQSLVLDPQRNINISFSDSIELLSYIVINRNGTTIPSTDKVAQRWMQLYKTTKLPRVEKSSEEFPNILRIVAHNLDELSRAADASTFKIEKTSATIYPRAECSFLEDLPPNTDETKILTAIVAGMGISEVLPSSIYVQFNKQTANALILASPEARKWIQHGSLTIDGRNISKKIQLAYRLVVSPVPRDFNIDLILNHRLFQNRFSASKHINDHLIVEFDDKEAYGQCLEFGVLRIDDKIMKIDAHSPANNPENCEIDAENWYETEMRDQKPTIMTFVYNPQHPIFHYKWNAQNWLEQFNKLSKDNLFSKKDDIKRHWLRVTVMLNTIGTVRRKSYKIGTKEVQLKSERLKTIVYDHKSKLSNEKISSLNDMNTPFPSTSVKVVNEDCLVIYQQLVSEGRRPLLLNMANKDNPGGGYRKGDGAQEENLFRRSDYYQSLDLEIADKDRSERLYCTDKGSIKPIPFHANLYPMEEFGAIYTSGITVFRQTEDNGYTYMDEPLYDVCSIAMAAYRGPDVKNNRILANKYAAGTYKKIENIFAIAYHHEHDCLVLSALGCGAFKNPPKHVASLFKSTILKYAGFFNTIYFAIVDDHNTGNRMNPNGNFLPFQEILDGLIVQPSKTIRMNISRGPNRIAHVSTDGRVTLSDVYILDRSPCNYGAKCNDLKDAQHNQTYSHPSLCPNSRPTVACDQINNEVHTYCFIHHTKCKSGGECTNQDPTHLQDFEHPESCKDGDHCYDTRREHLVAYQHLPICRDALKCQKFLRRDNDHCKYYRHCKSICPFDNCCVLFHDKDHLDNTIHSFRPPCPFTPYNCQMYVQRIQVPTGQKASTQVENHCLQYSHVCRFGRQCNDQESIHLETSIHIARQMCLNSNKCSKLDQEDHLESYSHPDIRDIRLFCKFPGFECHDKSDNNHLRKYRHGRNYTHIGIARFSGFNKHVNFGKNQSQLIRSINEYVKASNWKQQKPAEEILDWIRALQPVHRCRKDIFESILVLGHVMSRYYMQLLSSPEHVSDAVMQHSEVREIFRRHDVPAVKKDAYGLIELLVETEFKKKEVKTAKTLAGAQPAVPPEFEYRTSVLENKLKTSLNHKELETIHRCTSNIAQASINLHSKPMGIGYDADQKLGTDKQVFSILGPHRGTYYGEIVIIFKQEIMLHPDANFSIQAATSFDSGNAYTNRPWLTDPVDSDKRIEHFHESKLHCSVPLYENAAAMELIALTGLKQKSMDVNLDAVKQRWMAIDSHLVFEGHLPQLIPLDYIDRIYMPKNAFDSLSTSAQTLAKRAFGKTLTTTNHATLAAYEKNVDETILDKITQMIKIPRYIKGTVITLAASNFEQHVILPTTVSQSYYLYRIEKSQVSVKVEVTYIYWQIMYGDMMLTIANQQIEPDKSQPNLHCLICYVAEQPSTTSDDYHESFSYLNNGIPFQHETNVHKGQLKAKSNRFYLGCNTDNFLTFCLKIEHNTGKIILSHAGPNSIYNHEKIEYQFPKSELDISRIDFIHISAGKHDVPVRNLTINHEPEPELHPSFDKDFKRDTSTLLPNVHATL